MNTTKRIIRILILIISLFVYIISLPITLITIYGLSNYTWKETFIEAKQYIKEICQDYINRYIKKY